MRNQSIIAWMKRPWCLVSAVLVAGALLVGVLWWRGRPERHLAWAEGLVRDGEPAEALVWLPVPEVAPATRERALVLRARVAVERGDLAEAVRVLGLVDPNGPRAADVAFWRGRALYAARQPLRAMHWFHAALERRPGDAEAYRWLAAAAYDLGDRTAAISALESLTRLEPKDARVWRTLGMIFKENVEYERARDAFERSLALAGAQPDVRLELAETLLKLGDPAGAGRLLTAIEGQVAEARRAELLAECYRLEGDPARLRETVDAGLAAAPDRPGLLAQKAQLDVADGHPEEALARLDRAVAADPYWAQTVYQRGVVLRQLGRVEEAARDIARAAALNLGIAEMSKLNEQAARDPHDAGVRYRLGQLCVDLGKPDLAASWYRAALACDPKHDAARTALNALAATRRGARGPGRGLPLPGR